jgi:hypothetical protein
MPLPDHDPGPAPGPAPVPAPAPASALSLALPLPLPSYMPLPSCARGGGGRKSDGPSSTAVTVIRLTTDGVVQVFTPSRTTLSVVGGSRPPSNRHSWRSAGRLGWAGLGTPGWAGARCRASLHAVARGHHGARSCSLQRQQRRRRDAGREGGGGAGTPALSSTRGRGRGGVQRSLPSMSHRALTASRLQAVHRQIINAPPDHQLQSAAAAAAAA